LCLRVVAFLALIDLVLVCFGRYGWVGLSVAKQFRVLQLF